MNPLDGPITDVQVVSTGEVRIRPQHRRSTGSAMLWWLATSRRWTASLPINVYVIRRGADVILFDAGQDRRSVTEPDYFPRGIAGCSTVDSPPSGSARRTRSS